MHEAIIALGSNLGNRVQSLNFAIEQLGVGVLKQSQVFETDPVGGPENQGAYLHMVAALETDLDPYALMRWLHHIEAEAGRVREIHWGPRTLDVDIIWIDGVTVSEPDLEVPHPRMRSRRFVMAPLADLAPDVAGSDWADRAEGHVHRVGPIEAEPG